jgi:steroid delta-isomerase-like uncharacterized protein
MSSPTIVLIEKYYAAFNAGDTSAFFELLTEDVAHDVNQGAREHGKAAFRAFSERMSRCYRERIEDLVITTNADGSRAAAEYVVHGSYIATDRGLPEARGQTYDLPGGAFFEIREGRIARVTNYYNLENWLQQVAGDSSAEHG